MDLLNVLEAFDFGKIQECINIKLKLDEHGITWDEFLSWVDDQSKRVQPKRKIPHSPQAMLKRKCPGCEQAWLRLEEVNNKNPRLMVGGDFKCQWFCLKCGWDEYSTERIEIVAEPYINENL